MSDLFEQPDNATPLDPQERAGLKQSWIAHRRDLNDAERANIVQGAAWARARRLRLPGLLTEQFAKSLHRRMFGDVWDWAGVYRRTERNLGIEPHRIANEMAQLFDDVRYWVEKATYPPDEIAVRLHHRLVVVHPFSNGNGRQARLMADVTIARLGGRSFSWGGSLLTDAGDLRSRYIAALRRADDFDVGDLVHFARS